MLLLLKDKGFFYDYRDNNGRLEYVFFVYLELIQIYKNNAKVLIYDYTYSIVKSKLPLLCFDFILRLRTVLLLAYVLMPDETYEGYI